MSKKNIRTMSDDQIEIFIESVKENECLYDKSLKSYSDKLIKRNAWVKVAENNEMTGKYLIIDFPRVALI